MLTAKIGTNRSDRVVWSSSLTGRGTVASPAGDRSVWPVGPTGLTGLGGVRVQLEFLIDLDL